jgi:NtrC-family two-component system sensor histidine kinase KinB
MTKDKPVNERAKASLELLYSISRELNAQLDLRELLQRVLQLTLESVQARSGSILVLDEHGEPTEGVIAVEGKVRDHSPEQLKVIYEHGLAGWVVENRQAALVINTREDPRWLQMPDEVDVKEPKSAISAPLHARNRVVGVLTLVRSQAGHFNEDDLALLTAIADQAGIAVNNAHLFHSEQERRKLAFTLQEIARTVNSTLDQRIVFDQILEQLERVIEFDSASIFLLDDGTIKPVAARGFKDNQAILDFTLPVQGGVLGSEVFSSGKPLVVEDVQSEPTWLQNDLIPESGLIRGWIGAPLIVRDRVVGMLNVDSHKVGAYGAAEVEVVSAFADQAATAVANAQLFAESQRRVQSMTALSDTARFITASLDLDEVLQRIVDSTKVSLHVDSASLALIDDKTNELVFQMASGEGAEGIIGVRLECGKGIAGWVAEHDEEAVVTDVQSDPRFYPIVDERLGLETRVLACVPIRVQDRPIGILEAINPRYGEFEQEQVDLLISIAGLAGTAIAHAQLFADTQEARKRYASLFEDNIDPIVITDIDGRITDANMRADVFLGYSCEELLRQDILQFLDGKDGHLPGDLHQLEPGKTVSYDSRITSKAGKKIPVEVHVQRITIGQDDFLQWFLRDISERLELAELRTDLTSMIFHDLRSPLGNIISSLEVMNASMPYEDEALQSVLSIAFRSSRRASRLVESLLDLDRLETNRAVLARENASIGALIAEAVEETHPTAEAKGQLLRMDLQPGLPPVDIDVDMIRRVLINLLDNAIKYTHSGGEIAIASRLAEGEIVVSVKDSGEGISAEDQERIFEKFTRLGQATRRKGLGLGLAFCRLAIEAHGGRIWVESEASKGSTFSFSLPV